VFVTLPDQRRYAFIGDLAWQSEGITRRELRPWLIRWQGRENPDEARENILRMAAIAAKFPPLVIVTAHDARSYGSVPTLHSSDAPKSP
jgi:N-acyl homoserine lactone hydrolase